MLCYITIPYILYAIRTNKYMITACARILSCHPAPIESQAALILNAHLSVGRTGRQVGRQVSAWRQL